MHKDTKSKPSSEDQKAKKVYRKPSVRAYGNIHDITLALKLGTGNDHAGQDGPRKTHTT